MPAMELRLVSTMPGIVSFSIYYIISFKKKSESVFLLSKSENDSSLN